MHHSVTSLIIVLLAAFFTPIILNRLKLNVIPVIVAEIIAGLIIGQTGFDLVEHGTWINILSSLGFIFLMFLSGVEIDFSVFVNKGKRKKLPNGKYEPNRFAVSAIIFGIVFVISFILGLIFVWMNFTGNAVFMTLVISTISLGVVMPTLKETGLMQVGIGQIILLVTVIADLVTMILLAVFVSFYDPNAGSMWLLLLLFVAGLLLYFVGKGFRHFSFMETMSKGTVQIGTRAIFTLIILLVGLSETVGAESILGAFLAGVIVSLLSPNRDMVQKLDSFGYGFLIPVFFVMVGVDLNLWKLFQDPRVFILIPLLFLGLLISKMVPILVLKKWYDWRTVIGSGFLLTSTMSLIVAAAKVGTDIGVIDQQMASALILLAVLTCIITPIAFRKIFPEQEDDSKTQLVFIGANQLTLPLSVELNDSQYDVSMYHTKLEKNGKNDDSHFKVTELSDYKEETLKNTNFTEADILVISTGDDERNKRIAELAMEQEIDRVIVRIETPEIAEELREKEVEVFSSIFSTKTVLKSMIQSPSMYQMLTSKESGLYQLELKNPEYDGVELRKFPFLGDTIIVRVFRNEESLIPHGDTELKLGDKIVVTGSSEHVDELCEMVGCR